MTDRVYTNLTITSGNLITKNIQCSAGLTCGNINASDVTIGNLTVTGFTTTVNVTEQNVVDTNITTGSLNATGITAGNINFTGSLYQNGVAYQGSQWTTTSGNVSYTGGSIVGTSVSATNMISMSQTTGTLVASSGITAGNINFTGSLYQNGALYSPSITRYYGQYTVNGDSSNISGNTSVNVAHQNLSLSSSGWTNTTGSTLTLQVSYYLLVDGMPGNDVGVTFSNNVSSYPHYNGLPNNSSRATMTNTFITQLANNTTLSIVRYSSAVQSGYTISGKIYISTL